MTSGPVKSAQASNPFIDALGPFREPPEWASILEHDPLDTFPSNPTNEDRDEFLGYAPHRFAVTKASLEIVLDIQTMIRAGYRDRDPTNPENLKRLYDVIQCDKPFSEKTPTFYKNAHCKRVMGITGTGKSSICERCVVPLPQVVRHRLNSDAQWLRHTQLVYLVTKMPGEGSVGGLLKAILASIDTVLGTDYYSDYSRRSISNADRGLKVAQLLAKHSVGMLVIEEMQAENFRDAKAKKELRVLFLGLLSFGVPLLLVGNPNAFTDISLMLQIQRRFNAYEPVTLWPYVSHEEKDWKEAVAPAIWTYQVVSKAEPFNDEVCKALWECSGGIPAHAQKLVTEVQRSVLRRKAKGLTVTELKNHYRTLESFHDFRSTIEGLVNRDDTLLIGAEDIASEDFVDYWKRRGLTKEAGDNSDESEQPGKDKPPKGGDWSRFEKNVQKAHKATKTRARNKSKKNEHFKKTKHKCDLRYGQNVNERLTTGLDELRDQVQQERRSSQGGIGKREKRTGDNDDA